MLSQSAAAPPFRLCYRSWLLLPLRPRRLKLSVKLLKFRLVQTRCHGHSLQQRGTDLDEEAENLLLATYLVEQIPLWFACHGRARCSLIT